MATGNFIVLRLIPPVAVDAGTFTSYLTGLTISVSDISYAQADTGVPLGTASFVAPPSLITHIVQHEVGGVLQSVATALIEYPAPPPDPEYGGPDLLINFQWPGGASVNAAEIYYNVPLYDIPFFPPPFPAPPTFQPIPDTQVSAFVTLAGPAGLSTIPGGTTVPNFATLISMVTTVLNADPGGLVTSTEIAALTVEQCRNLAEEIVYWPSTGLPQPSTVGASLEEMFTLAAGENSGELSDPLEQARQQFEGLLSGYYGTRDSAVAKLTNWIFALATAYWLEALTQAATQALVSFPVNPNPPPGPPSAIPTMSQAQIIFSGALGLDVPAEYFYALNVNMSAVLGQDSTNQKQIRQQVIYGADQQDNLNALKTGIAGGLITVAGMNPAQAVRIIQALNIPAGTSAGVWPISLTAGFSLVGWNLFETGWVGQSSWINYPTNAAWNAYQEGDDQSVFWPNLATNQAAAFLDLIMMALTRGAMVGANPVAQLLITAFGLTSVADVTAVTPAQWQAYFTANPANLPDFTRPGTTATRIAAFIQWVQLFFQLDPTPFVPPVAEIFVSPRYDLPGFDVLARTIAAYPIVNFPVVLNLATLEAAAALAVPGDADAQAWAMQAVETLNELSILASGLGTPAFEFSVMEALFARGFTTREQVLDLPVNDFQQALTGTIAFDGAKTIYANAGLAKVFPPPPGGVFGPINPGGLTDCIPPPWFSPLGPVAYLHEMLKVSERSTCERPFFPPAPPHKILQAHIDARRGPIEMLDVTQANLETPLPLIDIVNECLQRVAARMPPALPGAVYNTAGHHLGPYRLCEDHCDPGEQFHDCACEHDPCEHHAGQHEKACHKPAAIFGVLPEYATPATPVAANSGDVPKVWNKLAADFSACCLPYNQALDVNRTYLEHFRSCRFETMRTFRRCITEFVLDPVDQPADFQTHLWRYPVRLDIAIEYLGLSIEEFETLFKGVMPLPCEARDRQRPPGEPGVVDACLRQAMSRRGVICLPEFLKCTCLTYCEFLELSRCGFAPIENERDRHGFPECEPCCLDELCLRLPPGGGWTVKLAVFIRLWQKLRHHCGAGYTFAELADICAVLDLSSPDFIRQLAAFQILRDQFRLPLKGPGQVPAGATGADRTFLLSLWVGPAAAHWRWAVQELLQGIVRHAECHHACRRRGAEFIKLLEDNFDALSRLAGFDPLVAAWTWHAHPTHTLRFAEILAKIYASDFSVGEVLFLFTADIHLDGDDPFPLQDTNQAKDRPLEMPEEDHRQSLIALRQKLLHARVDDAAGETLTWRAIAASLVHDLGFDLDHVTRLGRHFFPEVLEQEGQPVSAAERRFAVHLLATAPAMWDAPPVGPFHYDPAAGAQLLWAVLPIADRAVLDQLSRISPLSPAEQRAVQDVYFQPRHLLSHFAMLFENFVDAQRQLIEDRDAEASWHWFRRQFALAHARCRVIAEHLAAHVEAVTSQQRPDGHAAAHMVLRHLFADENAATVPPLAPSWENDNGSVPPVTWFPPANGGGFAALLGLAGTGLDCRFTARGTLAWHDIGDAMSVFGAERDRENCPIPTVIPRMGLTLTPQQLAHVSVRNGLAMADSTGAWLGGAEGFKVEWRGVLLVDHEGAYHFRAGAPVAGDGEPGIEEARHRSWKIELRRGQTTWVLLRHHWPHEADIHHAELPLRAGAYEITVELVQHEPDFVHPPLHRQHTGFEIKYRGPDTHDRLRPLSRTHLFRTYVDHRLSAPNLSASAELFLHDRYGSSLRDIRRSYQRAFKALLFVHRFALSAQPRGDERCELSYMLSQPVQFAGWSTYRSGAVWRTHKANFDFNFLPVGDPYFPPAADDRSHPSAKRIAALFDWWERMFDYTRMRHEVRVHCDRSVWRLFEEARDQAPADPGILLRQMGADARHWLLDLTFYQSPFSPAYHVTSADLQDDRWTIRAFHAELWLRRFWEHFTVKDITRAEPWLWAADDPSVPVAGSSGNANLLRVLCDGCFDNGEPRRYEEVRRLNDGLRERGRDALLCYLCGPGRFASSAEELSGLLLLDVRVGLRETASRIEDAISSLQTFIRRARMGLEPGWIVSGAFAHMWDCRFISFRVWQACKRRELYKENWIDWTELEKAERIEAVGFLDEQLKRATLTIAVPGGVDWWPDHLPPSHPALCLLQRRDPAEMQLLPAPREGLDLLARPERDARPSWITAVPEPGLRGGAGGPALKLPFWIEAAIRLGTRFVRLDAASYPPASTEFRPHHRCDDDDLLLRRGKKDEECCGTCCEQCGCEHPVHIDGYWFWLIDSRHFDPDSEAVYTGDFDGEQNAYYNQNAQSSEPWHDPSNFSVLLGWPSSPMVRLAWCRVHNGQFQQPRRSDWGIAYTPGGAVPDLNFLGRVADSLYFAVTNPGTSGFRYDMVQDLAVEIDTLALPPPPPPPPPGNLPAYPFFCYFEPGARLFPWSLFAPAIAVARALRAHCRFEAALKWYELVERPLHRDNRWALCEPRRDDDAPQLQAEQDDRRLPTDHCCCDTTDITCREARERSLLLHYLDTVREWGDALMRRNSPEAFQQARVAFDLMRKIMGRHPRVIANPLHPNMTVGTFKPLWAPINPRLMTLYDQLDDRLALIHERESHRRLVEGRRGNDNQYWDDDPVRGGWRNDDCGCCDTDGSCLPCLPYRFTFRMQKARELATQSRDLGALLLAAFEKGDVEFLASVRARHERELAHLNLRVREDVWRDADWQVQALEKSKLALQSSRQYFAGLIANGLNANENAYVANVDAGIVERTAANVLEGTAEAMTMTPDLFVGQDNFMQIPVGTKLAGLFKTLARVSNTLADISNSSAALDLTEAGWDRRLQDWIHQVQVLDIEIEQTERLILGAERRRNQNLRELNIQQREIEQATETLDLLRDRFTNHALYLYLQKSTADLHRQIYAVALSAAHECEWAFNFERGHTTHKFIDCHGWDDLHEGLLAGDCLLSQLSHMEKAYFDHNCREYELTKTMSLRLSFPMEFLRLKLTGCCEIEIPEWMFDLDYPGQYMRRIRNVSLTIPCVAGPYNEVHCRLTLLRNGTRIDPLLIQPAQRCCDCCQSRNGYPVCPHDPRWVGENGALEAIATSSGRNDAGLFEVDFHDDRYLPFEFRGAVSRWRIELPHENNYFDMETLSDLILRMNYTAREGGEALRHAAREACECDLPGSGWCLFDLRHDFSDAWELFHMRPAEEARERVLDLGFTRAMFPFVPGGGELFIRDLALLFDRPCHCECECPGECACCADPAWAHHELRLRYHETEERSFRCVEDDIWPCGYHGIAECVTIGPLHERRHRERIKIVFPPGVEDIDHAYVLCRYIIKRKCTPCVYRKLELGRSDGAVRPGWRVN
jgi:hypothetical protein